MSDETHPLGQLRLLRPRSSTWTTGAHQRRARGAGAATSSSPPTTASSRPSSAGTRYRANREVLTEGLRQRARRARHRARARRHDVLARPSRTGPSFPDVSAALGRAAGARLADRPLTNWTATWWRRRAPPAGARRRRRDGGDAGSYKPAHGHFDASTSSFGVRAPHGCTSRRATSTTSCRPRKLGLPASGSTQREQHDPSLAAAVLPDLTGVAGRG